MSAPSSAVPDPAAGRSHRNRNLLIAVTGSIPIIFSDYSMQKPNSFSVLSVDDHGTMELHLLFTHA